MPQIDPKILAVLVL